MISLVKHNLNLRSKRAVAKVTVIGTFSCMRQHVTAKVVSLAETHLTDFAGMRLGASMHQLMSFQGRSL